MNASRNDAKTREANARAALVGLLDELDKKYGPKPSLLATRADYVESAEDRESLLRTAYSEAQRIHDTRNIVLIAESLAQLYIEEIGNLDEGAQWLGVWKHEVGIGGSDHDHRELARLEKLLLERHR